MAKGRAKGPRKAIPRQRTVKKSITTPTEFAICRQCGRFICREFVGTSSETDWYHRYEKGTPVKCPKEV